MLESAAVIVGILKFIMATDTAMASTSTGFIIAAFSAIATTLAFYFTANVAQKKIES